MKKLLSIRAWLKSKTLMFFAVLGAPAVLDVSFFEGNGGLFFFSSFLYFINSIPGVDLSGTEGLSALVIVLSLIGITLRSVTTKSLEDK